MKTGLNTSHVRLAGNPRAEACQCTTNLTLALLSVVRDNEYGLMLNYVRRKHAREVGKVKMVVCEWPMHRQAGSIAQSHSLSGGVLRSKGSTTRSKSSNAKHMDTETWDIVS